MLLLRFTKIKMLRAAALICILSYGLCDERLVSLDINAIYTIVFGPPTSDATNSNQCINQICTEQQCSNPTPDPSKPTPDPSKIITLRILQDRQCPCSCCGYRKIPKPTLRILGDIGTRPNEFPWIVAILKVEDELGIKSSDYKCVGSLIHPSVVLTAAHCISKIKPSELIVRVGEHNTSMSVENNSQINIPVTEYIIHEQNTDYGYDIALMFLENPVYINEYVSTVCLPAQKANFDSQKCLVSGWGKNAPDGKFQATLKTVELPIVPRDECIRSLRATELGQYFELSDSMICAGGEANKDTCEGDGGAPLVCKIPGTRNRYHQVGIVAWGVGCGNTIPAAYTDVAKFRNWIDEKLRNKNLT